MKTLTAPQPNPEATPPPNDQPCAPFDRESITLTKREYIQLKWEAQHWRELHQRALNKIAKLEQTIGDLQARVRDLTKRYFGRKSEAHAATSRQSLPTAPPTPRPRGQQPQSRGHGRTPQPDLPVVTETIDVPPEQRCCASCGRPFAEFQETADAEIIEVEVRAYRRRVCRRRYRRCCTCAGTPAIITAPPAPRVIPKSALGISVWCKLLLDKFDRGAPVTRTLEEFAAAGYHLAAGTVAGALPALLPLFKPLWDAFVVQQDRDRVVHADETRWLVFAICEGKRGHRWYLWVTRTTTVVVYRIDPSRGSKVLDGYVAHLKALSITITLVCDRYSAYKKLARLYPDTVRLAFCWTHVRRDFVEGAARHPAFAAWMEDWVATIGELYQRNQARLAVWDARRSLDQQSAAFADRQRELEHTLEQMSTHAARELQCPDLHDAQRKVLDSLMNHWPGLVVFREDPAVPMDNNAAERALRPPVTGRKNYYGSGSRDAAELAAILFSVVATLKQYGLNLYHWLQDYLSACADNGSHAPADLTPFLPWAMTPQRRVALQRPAAATGAGSQEPET